MKLSRQFSLSSSIIVAAATKSYSFVSIGRQRTMLLSTTTTVTNGDVAVSPPSPPPSPIDVTLTCSDGVSLSAQIWKPAAEPTTTVKHTTSTRRIVCVHGWMDNCRSYHYFAPQLQQRVTTMLSHDDTTTTTNMEIAAIDLPGHGWSSHKSSDAPPVHITDYVYYLAEAISQLPWSTTTTTATSTNGSTNGKHEMHNHESNGEENDDQDNSNNGIVLVGHSMGAAICCMYAAAFPEQVDKLVLLEGGTFHSDSNDILQNIYIYIYIYKV